MQHEHELAAHALAHRSKKTAPKKVLKEFHAKELHDGTYSIHKQDGKGGMKEESAQDLAQVHDKLDEHMGPPNDGAAQSGDPGQNGGATDAGCPNCSEPDCPGCDGGE